MASSADNSFTVLIVAAGPVRSGGLVYAVGIKQEVQSWTVLRSKDDFRALEAALSQTLTGIEVPPCPMPSSSMGDRQAIVIARNEMQDWLTTIVMTHGAAESEPLHNFLTFGANMIPPQYDGVEWINFTPSSSSQGNATNGTQPYQQPSSRGTTLDEMEMEEMFGVDDEAPADDYDDDDDDFIPASVRYKPTDEAISQEDEDEIMALAGEVEMVEDVGSLAQSLGASHLGRSLKLQAEMTSRTTTDGKQHAFPPVQGVTIGATPQRLTSNNSNTATTTAAGGIGNAMQQAAKVRGLGDSFNQKRPVSAPRLDSFKMIKVIGKGSFGKVFLVKEYKTGEMFALKVLKKDNIIRRNQVEHTKTERSVLGYVQHPFIVALNMAFQSKDKLYFVLDYCAGGELFFHLGIHGKFHESRARFYTSEITLAISYVHSLDIIYRDLKPENVLLDSRGHVRLTDFGLSKEGISSSSSGANSFCGTPEYLAPEILNRQGHGRAVDWWSLGALLYEMLTGLPPFYCQDREKLFQKIRNGDLNYPPSLSRQAKTILRGLLTRDPKQRLGSGPEDAEDIKRHEFFSSIDWVKLYNGELPPPWTPQINSSHDTSQFDREFTTMPVFSPASLQRAPGFGTTPQGDNPFEGFTFTDHKLFGPGQKAEAGR
eukprot:CAMPEP_0202478042 /NCGR_PEP_ID=MMETSP1360-20130828/94251_1 /ASSEMBLY_ACC=CAM_ASM_000848 /TAXON_ID=515479 /ORGANISM="Licmophora paradoxa, Strain CCMP2313" /LENGTH=653 /DNA_ID=CAMNT_0049105303 /DNA_START=318 /DNA_END=2279 /DNA_ORIENTATION=+